MSKNISSTINENGDTVYDVTMENENRLKLMTANTYVDKNIVLNIPLTDKANLNSPVFSGTPTVPTAADGNASLQIANTKFVSDAIQSALGDIPGAVVDTVMSDSSSNPVENKVIKNAIDAINTKIDNLIKDAPEAYDTLKEISDYIAGHKTEYEALLAVSGDKVDKISGKGLSTNDYTTDEKNKLAGIASGAEVNQNAFSNIIIGSATVAADSKTDSLTLIAGSNVTLTPNTTDDSITIAATDTTYNDVTTSTHGLMSAADKTKLDGIATGANAYIHPASVAGAKSSGLYKITTDANGHVTAATAVVKSDITGLGIPESDTNTTYSAGTGLSLSGTTINHSNSITAATAQGDATKTLTFGGTFTIPTVTYDAQGHITGKGTTTMTMPANPNTDTKNSAGSTDTSSKIYLVGATSQAANPQTYSDNQVYATNGQLDANKIRIAETATMQYNSTAKAIEFIF